MIDLSKYRNYLSEKSYRVLTIAIEESRRRQHYYLGAEHILFAIIKVEEDLFSEIMRDLNVDPNHVFNFLKEQLDIYKQYLRVGMKIPPATKLIFKIAWEEAQKFGRGVIEPIDLLAAIFKDPESIPAKIMKSFGVDAEEVREVIAIKARIIERREEELKKKYELPPNLKHMGVNLNKLAREGKIHPVFGREEEIMQMIEILSHKERANSVMIIGDPGVGKTALVEGFAFKLEYEPESIPKRLRNYQIVNLQMNTVVAGTIFRGMFEDRMEKIINEVKERKDIILFIDEAHTIIGAGSAMGVPADAANILKSCLARGEVQIIGATTATEYKQFIQEDEALARRFRVIHLQEPSLEETRKIVEGIVPRLEKNYGVRISNEAVETALTMSKRYMRSLKLPDKVIAWLDTACVKTEINHPEKDVGRDDIIEVISQETRIPKDMIFRDTVERFKNIEEELAKRVVGQREAIKSVARHLRLNKGPLKERFERPDAVLLFLGPTGVGKTELAKALAEFLFGDENKMVRLDMSEYRDGTIGVDKLIGMPRGIVGSERGGILTNQIRDNPYTVVLLDEMEKASTFVLNLFLQVFDEGFLTDGRGRKVYFSDSVIIMTSNVGSEEFRKCMKPMGFLDSSKDLEGVKKEVIKKVEDMFSPEFLNRIDDIVVFSPLSQEEVVEIARMYIEKIKRTLIEHGKEMHISDEAISYLAKIGFNPKYGARFLKRTIDEKLKIPITLKWKESDIFFVDVRDDELEIEAGEALFSI